MLKINLLVSRQSAALMLFFLIAICGCSDCPESPAVPDNASQALTVELPEHEQVSMRIIPKEIMIGENDEIFFEGEQFTALYELEKKIAEDFDPEADRVQLICDTNTRVYAILDIMKMCAGNKWKVGFPFRGE